MPADPMSEERMSVDDRVETAVADPPVATPDIEHELEMLQGARHQAMSTLSRRIQNALDRGDCDAADFYDEQLTMVNLKETCRLQLSYVFADCFD